MPFVIIPFLLGVPVGMALTVGVIAKVGLDTLNEERKHNKISNGK